MATVGDGSTSSVAEVGCKKKNKLAARKRPLCPDGEDRDGSGNDCFYFRFSLLFDGQTFPFITESTSILFSKYYTNVFYKFKLIMALCF